jgi:hypothetical protein
MIPDLHVYEIEFGEEICPLFFLINRATATALPLWKPDHSYQEDDFLQFKMEPDGPSFSFSHRDESTYSEYYVYLLVAEITRQVGFDVTHLVYNLEQARNTFGDIMDEFLEAHQLPNG